MAAVYVLRQEPATMRVPSLTRSLSTLLGRGDSERLSSFISSCSIIVAQLGLNVSTSDSEREGPWQSLPVELVERIAALLPPNEVACNFRMVNKGTAQLLSRPQHITVDLSQLVPHHAFAAHWSQAEATRPLTHKQRQRLLCLVAATGCLDNLQLLAQHAGFALSAQVLGAAAAGGHVDTCRWLRAEGAPWTDTMQYSVLDAAAASGQGHMVDWLLDNWCSWSDSAAGAAARGGHVALVQKLLALHEANPARRPVDPRKLLEGAAEGCSAAELKVLHDTWVHGRAELMEGAKEDVVAAAAGSCTPDWRAKLEFLVLGRAYPRTPLAYKRAVAQPDALERMVWLQRAGFPLTKANGSVNAVHFAALTGGVDALRYLLDNGGVADAGAASRAASRGNVDALRELHARGCPIPSYALREAAEAGHLLTVSWLADLFTHQQQQQQQQEEEAVLTADVFAAAAESGSLELMQWLAARGCPMDAEAFTAAAHAGSQEQLEWLVEQGCPMGADGRPYLYAGWNGDVATLSALRRLGCPWDPSGETLARAVDPFGGAGGGCALPVLRWMAEQGCPVDWEGAMAAAELRGDSNPEAWVAARDAAEAAGAGPSGAGMALAAAALTRQGSAVAAAAGGALRRLLSLGGGSVTAGGKGQGQGSGSLERLG